MTAHTADQPTEEVRKNLVELLTVDREALSTFSTEETGDFLPYVVQAFAIELSELRDQVEVLGSAVGAFLGGVSGLDVESLVGIDDGSDFSKVRRVLHSQGVKARVPA
jgi:hypothetical protein